MKVLGEFTLKLLKHNKKNTILAISSVILACILMFGAGLGASTLRANMVRETINNYGDYHTVFEDIPYKNIDVFTQRDDISRLMIEQQVGYTNIQKYLDSFIDADENNIPIIGGNNSFLKSIELISGKLPTSATEIIIPQNIIFDNINIGKQIELDIQSNDGKNIQKDYTIVGIYDNSKRAVFNTDISRCFYTSKDKFDQNALVNFYINYKEVKMNILEKNYKIADSLGLESRYSMNGIIYEGMNVNQSLLELYGVSNSYGIIAVIIISLMLICGILGVACFFVICNSFLISVSERKKMFGILSSIGATPKQILGSVFFEALIISIFGLSIGILISFGIVEILIMIVNHLLANFINFKFSLAVYPIFIFVSFFFIIATIFLSALVPAMRAREITPIEAIMQTSDIKIKNKKIKTHKWIRKIFGMEGELALKNIKRNKSKYNVTIISIFISVILFISFGTFINIGIMSSNDVLTQPNSYDISVSIYGEFDNSTKFEDLKNKIRRISTIDKITLVESDVFYTNTDISNIYSPDAKEFLENYQSIYGPDYGSNEKGIKINPVIMMKLDDSSYKELLNKNKLKEEIPILLNYFNANIELLDGSFKKFEGKLFKSEIKQGFNICLNKLDINSYVDGTICNGNIYRLNDFYLSNKIPFGLDGSLSINPIFILPSNLYDQFDKYHTKPFFMSCIYINAKDYMGFDKEFKKLMSDNMMSESSYVYHNFKLDMHNTRNIILSFKLILYMFISLIVLIAVTSIFNTISTSINLRRKEFAMLRSVGLSPKGFKKIIFFESFFFAFKSLIYSIPVAIYVIYLIYRIFGIVGNDKFETMQKPIGYVIGAIVGVFIIVYVSMYYASKKIKNEAIADVIKEDI